MKNHGSPFLFKVLSIDVDGIMNGGVVLNKELLLCLRIILLVVSGGGVQLDWYIIGGDNEGKVNEFIVV